MDAVKLALPFLKKLDKKWKVVSTKTFNKKNFRAHSSLYESLRVALSKPKTLMKEVQAKREPASDEDESQEEEQQEE